VSWEKHILLQCDTCAHRTTFRATSVRTARKQAKRSGWLILAGRDGGDYCPVCWERGEGGRS
jgi:hypothetical protein